MLNNIVRYYSFSREGLFKKNLYILYIEDEYMILSAFRCIDFKNRPKKSIQKSIHFLYIREFLEFTQCIEQNRDILGFNKH